MTTETILTPETLTFDIIKSWDGATMKKHMQHPEMRDAIYREVQKQNLATVEAAQAQIEANSLTPEVPVVDEAARVAEEQRVAAEARVTEEARVAAEAAKNRKVVVEYQIKDEDGNPIGRPTHLEAATQEELIEKMKEAHTQATRAFHRLKKQKVQSLHEVNTQAVVPAAPATMSDGDLLAAIKDLKSDDPKVALEAHRKLNKVEFDRVQAEADAKVAQANELRRQEKVTFDFLKAHRHDYNNCEANTKLLEAYFEENQLAWTTGNLEIAIHALENELAPVTAPVVAAAPANPVPAAATVPVTTAVSAPAQSVAAAPAQAAVAANPTPSAPRPGVNGGIVPGQNSAPRPAATGPKGLTMDEINAWDGPTMRAKMRNPQTRAEIERVVAEAKVRRGR